MQGQGQKTGAVQEDQEAGPYGERTVSEPTGRRGQNKDGLLELSETLTRYRAEVGSTATLKRKIGNSH